MNETQKNDLFYVCSLIEYLGRKSKKGTKTFSVFIVKVLAPSRFFVLK